MALWSCQGNHGIFFSSPLAEAPPQTSTSPALFGVRSMHIAKPHLDNPPSTCNGLLLTHQKQQIPHPPSTCASPRASQPHCPLTSPQHGVLELSRVSSCPESRAAPRADSPQPLKQRSRSQTTLGGPKLISNGRGGASKLAPRCFAESRIRRPENSGRGCFEAGSSRKITIFAVCRESIPSDFSPREVQKIKKSLGFG